MGQDGLILLLTGGLSVRMGSPKALLPLHGGSSRTFLAHLVEVTADLARHRAVVTSLPPEALDVALPTVVQERPEEGQLSSLLLGWRAFGRQAAWVMLVLVDHPYVDRGTYQALLKARADFPRAMLWTSSYQQRAGHPVIFSSLLLEQLAEAPLQEGARPVVQRNTGRRHFVEVDDQAVLWNVDTPELYQHYSELFLRTV